LAYDIIYLRKQNTLADEATGEKQRTCIFLDRERQIKRIAYLLSQPILGTLTIKEN